MKIYSALCEAALSEDCNKTYSPSVAVNFLVFRPVYPVINHRSLLWGLKSGMKYLWSYSVALAIAFPDSIV